jgi:hypothetical protein
VSLTMTLTTPFAPYPGLEIYAGDIEEKIESVAWDQIEERLICWAPKDDEIFRRFRELATSEARQELFDALVEAYEEMGWVQR